MVHEAFVPTESLKQTIMTTWQRYQLWRLGNASDTIFFSIDPWVQRFSRWFPDKKVIHAPVGSNIPRRSLTQEQARAELDIDPDTFVVGAFGSDHESRLWAWVIEAAEAVARNHSKPLFLYAGSAGQLLNKMVRSVPYRDLGRVPAAELSAAMTSMDLFLSPFAEGISSRKGSAIIGLQHGVATLTTAGPQTDSLFHNAGLELTDCGDQQSFVRKAVRTIHDKPYRDQIARSGLGLHSTVFEWDVVADVFQRAFENET
jgi:glycosyltransferase involved in cell wall biosynthesis